MTPGLRFHFDEHVDPAIADALRLRGIDVTTTVEAGLIAASDDEQIAYAVSQNRVIVTHDQDFLALAANGKHHAGICYCHLNARSVSELIKSLALIAFCVEPTEMINHVEFL